MCCDSVVYLGDTTSHATKKLKTAMFTLCLVCFGCLYRLCCWWWRHVMWSYVMLYTSGICGRISSGKIALSMPTTQSWCLNLSHCQLSSATTCICWLVTLLFKSSLIMWCSKLSVRVWIKQMFSVIYFKVMPSFVITNCQQKFIRNSLPWLV